MITRKLFFCAAMCLVAGGAYAVPAAKPDQGKIDVSAYAQTIDFGADAHSYILEADYGIKPNLGITADLTRIGDSEGRSYIGSLYLRRPVYSDRKSKYTIDALAGVTWVGVKDDFGNSSNSTGATIGVLSDYYIYPDLSVYGSASVAFLDEAFWTYDLGVRFAFTPRWFLTAGYRGYDADGGFGGFLIGATYKISTK